MAAHTARPASTAHGARPRKTPALVAIPFPPLKPTQTLNMWPTIAAAPNASVQPRPAPARAGNSHTGRKPFPMSSSDDRHGPLRAQNPEGVRRSEIT